MRTLSSDIKDAVFEMNQKGTWAHLYEVQINANTAFGDASNEYLTDYPKQITYATKNYRPFPIVHDAIPQTSKPEQISFVITVANIDKAIALYLESGKILGNSLKITWVFLKQDATVIYAFDEVYQIISAEINDTSASVNFEVGQANLFEVKLPKNRWQDSRCEWVYKSIGFCDYGRDEFKGISKVRINTSKANGKDVIHGWKIMNASNASLMSIDNDYLDELLIKVEATVNTQWNVSTRTGPFLYRLFPSADFTNFEVEVKFNSSGDEDNETLAMLFCTDSDTTQDWVLAGRRRFSGVDRVQLLSMDDNSYASIYDVARTESIFKIKKTAGLFELFVRANENVVYGAAIASVTRNDLNGVQLRAGLTAETYSAARSTALQARFDYWRLLSGGKLTCLRTPGDCVLHDNINRLGAAVGILHGPFSF